MGQSKSTAPKLVGAMGSSGGGGLQSAVPMVVGIATGGKGKATFSGDSFSKKNQEKEEVEDTKQENKVNTTDDMSFENIRQRLLDKAKEERVMLNQQMTRERETYDRSLPTSPNEIAAEKFLGKDYKENVKDTIKGLPKPLQMMVGGK